MHTKTTTALNITLRADLPISAQIADQIRRLVASGRLLSGDRIPTVRGLAVQLKVDPGTVARAYQELERQGIVSSRRGGGSFVATGASEERLTEQERQRLALVVEKSVLEALGLGFSTDEIEIGFTLCLADWRERRARSTRPREAAPVRQGNEIRFAGSHDLAVELLARHLSTCYPQLSVTTRFVGSLAGLSAVACGEADIAGTHLMDEETGEFNIPFVRRLMPNDSVVVINLLQRFQGLMLAAKNPKRIAGVGDLRGPGITFVNRQKGSGTRILLDSLLLRNGIPTSEVSGYEHEEKTHMAVASLVAQGQADVALGAQSAASVTGLDFIPLVKERYDLVARADAFNKTPLRHLREVITSETFRSMLKSIPGCDASETGKVTTVSKKE